MNYITADAAEDYVTADGAACYVTADDAGGGGATLQLMITVTGTLNVNVTAAPSLSEAVSEWIDGRAETWPAEAWGRLDGKA
jgi:hypothetical protein